MPAPRLPPHFTSFPWQRKKAKLIPSLDPERRRQQQQDEKPGKKPKIADKDERKKFFAARARAEKGESGTAGIDYDRMAAYKNIKKDGRKEAKRRRRQMGGQDAQ